MDVQQDGRVLLCETFKQALAYAMATPINRFLKSDNVAAIHNLDAVFRTVNEVIDYEGLPLRKGHLGLQSSEAVRGLVSLGARPQRDYEIVLMREAVLPNSIF